MTDSAAEARIDQALVARALLGNDRRAFEHLMRRHQGMVRAQLCRLLHGDQVHMKRSAHKVRFLHPKGWSYYATLRRKLRWYEGVV